VNQTKKLNGVKVPETIKESEKDFFHIMFITSRPNQAKMEYVHKSHLQVVNKESYENSKNNYMQLGYSKVVILHNPYKASEKPVDLVEKYSEQLDTTLENLKEYADDNNIELKSTKKADVQAEIAQWLEENQ